MRYKKQANSVISVDINNEYSIYVMLNRSNTNKKYYITLFLKHKSINILDMLEKYENIEFTSTSASINSEIKDFIKNEFNEGNFTYYINRFEYQMKCFDEGNRIYEKEIIKDV